MSAIQHGSPAASSVQKVSHRSVQHVIGLIEAPPLPQTWAAVGLLRLSWLRRLVGSLFCGVASLGLAFSSRCGCSFAPRSRPGLGLFLMIRACYESTLHLLRYAVIVQPCFSSLQTPPWHCSFTFRFIDSHSILFFHLPFKDMKMSWKMGKLEKRKTSVIMKAAAAWLWFAYTTIAL